MTSVICDPVGKKKRLSDVQYATDSSIHHYTELMLVKFPFFSKLKWGYKNSCPSSPKCGDKEEDFLMVCEPVVKTITSTSLKTQNDHSRMRASNQISVSCNPVDKVHFMLYLVQNNRTKRLVWKWVVYHSTYQGASSSNFNANKSHMESWNWKKQRKSNLHSFLMLFF